MERANDIFLVVVVEYLNDDNAILYVYFQEREKSTAVFFPSQSTQLCVVFLLVSLVRFVYIYVVG